MFKCEICEREFETLHGIKSHVGQRHKKEIIKEFKCEICGKEFEALKGLIAHIGQIHKNEISQEEYYLKFIGDTGKCPECGKDTMFNSLKDGYSKFCSLKCSNNSIDVQNKKKESRMKNPKYDHLYNYESKEKFKLKIECKICGKKFESLPCHISLKHKNEITLEEYYLKYINSEKGKCHECGKDTTFRSLKDGYSKFCNNKCLSKNIEVIKKRKETYIKNLQYKHSYNYDSKEKIELKIECKICGKKFRNLEGFGHHIGQIHKNEISQEEYYLKFIGEKGKCPECGKDTTFRNLSYGYSKFCSHKCSANSIEVKNKRKENYIEKTGYIHPLQNPVIRQKSIETYIKKTGYGNPSQNPESIKKSKESTLKNNNGRHPSKLTYKQVQERYPDVVEIEKLIEGPNGEIWGHCKNSSCKNSEENGGYFDVSKKIGDRNRGINGNDTDYFYCCEECKQQCPLYGRSASRLHSLLNENPKIPYTAAEYNIWKEEVYYRQRIENDTETNFCEKCHATENLQVHHEIPQKLEPGYSLDPINGIIFCEKCHYELGHATGTECSTGSLANKICK